MKTKRADAAHVDDDVALSAHFLAESADQLDTLDRGLAELARVPGDRDVVDTLLRSFHTIKGTAGCLGMTAIAEATDDGETALTAIRDARIPVTTEEIRRLTATARIVRRLIADAVTQHLARSSAIAAEANASGGRWQIGGAWRTLAPLVEELAGRLGKHVEMGADGGETWVDRYLFDAVRSPLTQIVRNAVAHGIERPEVRRACGKAAVGLLWLRVIERGGLITLEVSDDGAGIDAAQVRMTAVERGLLSREAAFSLSDEDALALIFLPGLSTSEAASAAAGRGVGMDVVRAEITQLGGTVAIDSVPGQGTTITLDIPQIAELLMFPG